MSVGALISGATAAFLGIKLPVKRRGPTPLPLPPPPPPPPSFDFISPANLLTLALAVCAVLALLFCVISLVQPARSLRTRYGNGRWALVADASGTCKTLVAALANQGINVVYVADDDERLTTAFSELHERFPAIEFRTVGVDLSLTDGSYISAIEKATDNLDVAMLFLNAGFPRDFKGTEHFYISPLSSHMDTLQRLAVSSVRISHAFLPRMYMARHGGLVVFISSSAAFSTSPPLGGALPSATHAFVSRLAKSLAVEAAPHGIDVLAVHPSPMGRDDDILPQQILRRVGCVQAVADIGIRSMLARRTGLGAW